MRDAGGLFAWGKLMGEALLNCSAQLPRWLARMWPAEVDAIERFFVRVEMTLEVKLRT